MTPAVIRILSFASQTRSLDDPASTWTKPVSRSAGTWTTMTTAAVSVSGSAGSSWINPSNAPAEPSYRCAPVARASSSCSFMRHRFRR